MELELNTFEGFYGSYYESELDIVAEDYINEDGLSYEDLEWNFKELAQAIFDEMIEDYKEAFGEMLINPKFKELDSPSFYNFRNDRIYFDCDINKALLVEWLIDIQADNDKRSYFKHEIYNNHTSCDGFISFNSNDLREWLKDLANFDSDNEKHKYKLGFLMRCEVLFNSDNDNGTDYELEIIERLNMNGTFYECVLPIEQINK